MNQNEIKNISPFNLTVLVASLGFFVDVYDLVLFQIVRKPSLADLGYNAIEQDELGLVLLNIQMVGLLIGGVIWGIIGDKKGRLSVLFGSIIIYSVANFLNAFVIDFQQYAILRFVSGFGLAGELGAGITLVSETMKKEHRGYGTMIVASIGVIGVIAGFIVAENFGWKTSYIIGGVLGFTLLLMRFGVKESLVFKHSSDSNKGSLKLLFSSKERIGRYFTCLSLGLPVWFIIGILITFSSSFAHANGVIGEISDAKSVMLCYTGLVFGDLASGSLSQYLKSRKKALFAFYTLSLVLVILFLTSTHITSTTFYFLCTFLGFSTGIWAIFLTVSAESFGTNLRSTVTTTAPNFVRWSLVPVSFIFTMFKSYLPLTYAAAVTCFIIYIISFVGLNYQKETFAINLNFDEK